MKLRPGVVDIVTHQGKSSQIQLLGIPKPLGVGIGDYGKIFQADIQTESGEVLSAAFKVYGQGLQERIEESLSLRDEAFQRYCYFESVSSHTFPWGAIISDKPVFITPFKQNIFSLNDFWRLNQSYARNHFTPEFRGKMGLLRGKIKLITNIEVCVEIFEHIAETCSALGVLLHDAYFFQFIHNSHTSEIQITPFIGDFDDSYKDLSEERKQSQITQIGMSAFPQSEHDFLIINLHAARKLLLELLDVLIPPDTDESFYKTNHIDSINRLGRGVIPL